MSTCELPPCPPCPPPPPPPCSQICPPPPPLPPCHSKPVMCGLHWAQTKRTLAQAIILSIISGTAVFIMGMQRKAAYKEYYKRGCFDDWADEMARKGLFQAVPQESLKDFKKKSENPDKSDLKGSPKKENPSSSKRGKKRVRKASDSSGDSEYTAKYSDAGSVDDLASDDDLDLTKFDQAIPQHGSSDELKYESDPLEIGKSYDIEFVDVLDQPSTSGANSTLASEKEIAHKRDLKKTILKSRFKRMGMLPVANFEAK